MNSNKKNQKEYQMIVAAEKVFNQVGFKNAKMEDIASEAGITKVTLYSYFQSKENLYLGVTYYGLQQLNDAIYETVDANKRSSGLDSIMAIIETFMKHCEQNYIASETLLDYFSLLRKSSTAKRDVMMTEATKDSIFFKKLQDIQNISFKLAANEIMKGQEDGSITKDIDPFVYTLLGWTSVMGYIRVLSAAGREEAPLFKVPVRKLKTASLQMFRHELTYGL